MSTLSPARLLALAAALFALLALSAPANAAKSCGQKVIDDWYDNSVVDGAYPLNCYRDALKRLPDDARTYSSAPDDIQRALQQRIRDQQKTPPPPASPSAPDEPVTTGDVLGAGPSNGDPPPEEDLTPEPGETEPAETGETGAADTGAGGGGDASNGIAREVLDSIGPESADGLPLPLLIVGGLALLLLAAGSAGLVARKLQARKAGGDGQPPEPPL